MQNVRKSNLQDDLLSIRLALASKYSETVSMRELVMMYPQLGLNWVCYTPYIN